MQKKIFVLTGEPSGDKLAAKAISKLKQINNNIEYLSVGGSYLKSIEIDSIFKLLKSKIIFSSIFSIKSSFAFVSGCFGTKNPQQSS